MTSIFLINFHPFINLITCVVTLRVFYLSLFCFHLATFTIKLVSQQCKIFFFRKNIYYHTAQQHSGTLMLDIASVLFKKEN